MKKTEKIEVRLSHEEKAELSRLADEEGRSVSELIRHLVKRYMSVNTGRLPRKLPWLALAGTGVVAFLAGHLLTYYIAKSHVDETNYTFFVHMDRESEGVRDDTISVPINLTNGFSQTYILPRLNEEVQVEVKIVSSDIGIYKLNTSFCRVVEQTCEIFAQPFITVRENDEAYMRFETTKGIQVTFGVNVEKG